MSILLSENIANDGLNVLREAGPRDASIFLSPLSITAVLAMAYVGARNNTKKEMNQVLFNGMRDQDIHNGFSKLMLSLKSNTALDQYQLRSVNRIYAQTGFEILEEFKQILQSQYKTQLHLADFKSPEAVRAKMNSYVSEQTNNKINDLIGSGTLDALTRLVLINAIYFKGDWATKFNPENTKDTTFHINENSEKQVPMMALKTKFNYVENENAQVLGLPYKGDELMFIAILPKEKYGLQSVEDKMDGSKMIDLIQSMRKTTVDVILPKFKLESSFNLKDVLKTLGIKDMFNMNLADFSGINGPKNKLYVSAVIHKAFIEVNEKGSEAAAASAVELGFRSMPPPTQVFNANHPFMFAIVNVKTNNVLFIGRYTA